MRVRKRLRRIKRLAYLGTAVGGLVAFRRAKAAREARVSVGPPSTWPPLQPDQPAVTNAPVASDVPVAAAGDLARDLDAEPGNGPAPTT